MRLTKYVLTEPLGNKYVLFINCLSGAVDILEKKNYQAIKSGQYASVSTNVLNCLKDRGYIFNDEIAEQKLLKNMLNKYTPDKSYKIIDFVICPTFDCNLACPYCFQKTIGERNLYLTKNSVPALTRALKKMNSMFSGQKAIQFFGGEPLLPKNKPFIKEIMNFSCKNKIPTAITTNGTTILHYRHLIKQYRKNIKLAQITIDGPPEIHDKRRISKNGKPTFHLIIKGIEFLLSNGIGVHARVNVDKSNVDSLPKLANILKEKGLFEKKGFKCALAPVANHCNKNQSASLLNENKLLYTIEKMTVAFPEIKVLSSDRIPKILKHFHSVLSAEYSSPNFNYCQANKNGYFIFAPDGLIYPCSEAAGHKELAVGSFLPNFKLDEEKLSLWNKRNILTLKKCRDCNIAPLCGGGCTYAAYGINGDISKPYCHDAHKVIKDYLKANKKQFLAMIQQPKIA